MPVPLRQLPDLEAFLDLSRHPPRLMAALPLVGLGLLWAAPAAAQTFSEARAQGMGGAVHADPLGNSAMVSNPAGLARGYMYGLEAGYFRSGPGDVNAAGLNIIDSKTQPSLAMGLSYGYEFSDSKTKPGVDGHDARLAFAHPMIPNQLSMGVGLHYMHFNRTGGPDDLKAFTLDAGLVFSLTPGIHLGVAGQNLINTHDAAAPMLAGGGLAYTGEYATLDFDTMADFTTAGEAKPVFLGGIELLLGKIVPIRAGVERNQASEVTRISGGLGFTMAEEGTGGSQFNLAFTKAVEVEKDFKFGAGFIFFL